MLTPEQVAGIVLFLAKQQSVAAMEDIALLMVLLEVLAVGVVMLAVRGLEHQDKVMLAALVKTIPGVQTHIPVVAAAVRRLLVVMLVAVTAVMAVRV